MKNLAHPIRNGADLEPAVAGICRGVPLGQNPGLTLKKALDSLRTEIELLAGRPAREVGEQEAADFFVPLMGMEV
jgi:hypothetical protein